MPRVEKKTRSKSLARSDNKKKLKSSLNHSGVHLNLNSTKKLENKSFEVDKDTSDRGLLKFIQDLKE